MEHLNDYLPNIKYKGFYITWNITWKSYFFNVVCFVLIVDLSEIRWVDD